MSYWAEGVVGPNFGLYFEDLKNFWAEILGSHGPIWTTYWVRHWRHGTLGARPPMEADGGQRQGTVRPPSAAQGGRRRTAASFGSAWRPPARWDLIRHGVASNGSARWLARWLRAWPPAAAQQPCPRWLLFYFLNSFLEAGDPLIRPKFHFKGRICYPPLHEVGVGTGSISKNLFLLVPRNCFRSSDYTVSH